MMSMFSKPLALASVLLFTSLAAVAATESNTSRRVAPPYRATVHCLGTSSVPLTADAEQGLPLRIVGDLPCGSVVSVLADDEGDAALVRTDEGFDGYVARSYLTSNGVVRWQPDSPGCAQFVNNGHWVESATANGVTVQVALEDTGWKLRAIIAVSNQGQESIEVLSNLVALDELAPNPKSLAPADPVKLSHVVNHQLLLSQASAHPPREAATFVRESSAGPTPVAYQTATPDYFGDDIFPVSASNSAAIVPSRTEIQSLAFKDTALKPGQATSGVIWFERSPRPEELSLRVSVGDLGFDFPLSFDPRK